MTLCPVHRSRTVEIPLRHQPFVPPTALRRRDHPTTAATLDSMSQGRLRMLAPPSTAAGPLPLFDPPLYCRTMVRGRNSAAMTWARAEVRRRWRALAVLGVLVGVTAGLAVAALVGSLQNDNALERLRDATNAHDITVFASQTDNVQPEWDQLRARPEVEDLAIWLLLIGEVDGEQSVLFAPGDDRWLDEVNRPLVTAGRMYDPSAPDEIVVADSPLTSTRSAPPSISRHSALTSSPGAMERAARMSRSASSARCARSTSSCSPSRVSSRRGSSTCMAASSCGWRTPTSASATLPSMSPASRRKRTRWSPKAPRSSISTLPPAAHKPHSEWRAARSSCWQQ